MEDDIRREFLKLHEVIKALNPTVAVKPARWNLCLYPTEPDYPSRPRVLCGLELWPWPDNSWRCKLGHFNTPEQLRSEALGRLVREVWVAWACDLDNPKPHHLLSWRELSLDERTVYQRIGETLHGMRDWRVNQTGRTPEDFREEYIDPYHPELGMRRVKR